ncbi:MAG TPA: SUMF1/EgtB/PvdO family nonheme iron enzyme, partial [Candidatus Dormibacteraeota bacterium]|nr:SUMF1/EgtB/PvdO family nonheme iron enzyme [Candidatus Dormibacteraeota bacterium]
MVVLVNTFREVGFTHKQRLAVLYGSDPHHRARLFAFIAKLRGWKVQAFDSFEDAIHWLSGGEEFHAEEEFTPAAKKVLVRKLKKVNAKPVPQPGIKVKLPAISKRDFAAPIETGKMKSSAARATAVAAIMALLTVAAFAQPTPEVVSATASAVAVTKPSPFAPTIENKTPAPTNAPPGMVWIPGGEFSMGCTVPNEGICTMATLSALNDAQPVHRVYVDGFWMDKTDVTNDEFEKFVKATGYRTIAEIAPTQEQFPSAPPENLVAGSTVFTPSTNAVTLNDYFQWWRYVHGANWRHPTGPDSDLKGRGNYPVLQVAYADAAAYAKWAGKRLPTEAE